jgi:hypothetical protein
VHPDPTEPESGAADEAPAGPDADVLAQITLLDSEEWRVRQAAAQTLESSGPRAIAALPRLRVALRNDSDYDVRECALSAIAAIDPDENAVFVDLELGLSDVMDNVRVRAAGLLAELDQLREPAARLLEEACRNEQSVTARQAFVVALGQLLGQEDLVRTAVALLHSGSDREIQFAVTVLTFSDLHRVDGAELIAGFAPSFRGWATPVCCMSSERSRRSRSGGRRSSSSSRTRRSIRTPAR